MAGEREPAWSGHPGSVLGVRSSEAVERRTSDGGTYRVTAMSNRLWWGSVRRSGIAGG